MKQNILTLNRDKTELLVFQLPSEEFHYNGSITKPKVCCYLGLMLDKLKFDLELNKMLMKMATAIRSI